MTLWNRGYARARLVGAERTMNPTPAAFALLKKGLGKKRATIAVKRAKRGRRSFFKGNPVAAQVASLVPGGSFITGLLGLGGRFKEPSEKTAASLAPAIVQSANSGNLTAARGLLERAAKPLIAKEAAVWKAAAAQLAPATIALVKKHLDEIPQADQSGPKQFAQSVVSSAFLTPAAGAAAPSTAAQLLAIAGQPGTIRTIASLARPKRQARGRYPTYTDRYGRQRYSTKPPGSELRLPAGATPSPGTAYSFFRGAIGKGGAAATAGQLAIAGAAGVAAYLVTSAVLKRLGGRALGKEEAGVQAALAHREALLQLQQKLGRKPNQAELLELKNAYRDQLEQLGYDPDTFQRTRSGLENFLSDYNPLD